MKDTIEIEEVEVEYLEKLRKRKTLSTKSIKK